MWVTFPGSIGSPETVSARAIAGTSERERASRLRITRWWRAVAICRTRFCACYVCRVEEAELLLSLLDPAKRDEAASHRDLGGVLRRQLADARAAWPGVAHDDARYLRALAA